MSEYKILGEFIATQHSESERHVVISCVECPSSLPYRLQDVDITGKWKNVYMNCHGGVKSSANRSNVRVNADQIVNDENDSTVKSSPVGADVSREKANGNGVGLGGGLRARFNESLTGIRQKASMLNCLNVSNENDDTKGVATTTAAGHCRTSDEQSLKNSGTVENKKKLDSGFPLSESKKKLSPAVPPKSAPVGGGIRNDIEEDGRKENAYHDPKWLEFWSLKGNREIYSSWTKEYEGLKMKSAGDEARDWADIFNAHCDVIHDRLYQEYCKNQSNSKAAGFTIGGMWRRMKDNSNSVKTEDEKNLDADVVDPQKEKSSPNSGIKKGNNVSVGQSKVTTGRGGTLPRYSGTGTPNVKRTAMWPKDSRNTPENEMKQVTDFLMRVRLEYSPTDESRKLKFHTNSKTKSGYFQWKGKRNVVNSPSGSGAENNFESIKANFSAMQIMPEWMQKEPEMWRYWIHRYRIFEKFDEGVQLDKEAWYSTTMETLARHLAERCKADRIVDAFCGVGGGTIQFAKKCREVIAIDQNPDKIKMAEHNAIIYGSTKNVIKFKVGDSLKMAEIVREAGKVDVVFLDVPWGGPEYRESEVCDIRKMGVDCFAVMEAARKLSNNIAVRLPRNANVDQIIQLARPGERIEIEKNCVNGGLKSITVYFGDLVDKAFPGRTRK